MNGNELKEKLDELKTEDYVWLLYIGIIIWQVMMILTR